MLRQRKAVSAKLRSLRLCRRSRPLWRKMSRVLRPICRCGSTSICRSASRPSTFCARAASTACTAASCAVLPTPPSADGALMKRILTSLAALAFAASAAAAEPVMVIYDNDFYGPTSADILPLIGNPDVTLLGITAVSGDAWRDEGAAYVLRSLELYHRTDVPVYLGAVDPLVNSEARTRAWEQTYGKFAWKGAWNPAEPGKHFHPTAPFEVPALEEGNPAIKAQPEGAVQFMIRMVHEHPHQVV